MRLSPTLSLISSLALTAAASAAPFELLTGVDATRYPGVARPIFPIPGPGPGFPSGFPDGDRLAGTADVGSIIAWQGVGTPFRQANDVGAMSFIFRRGTVPFGGPTVYPFMGIEALGGKLVDLDGDASNPARSLIPVSGQTPVELPGTFSHIDLTVNLAGGTIGITDFEATGTNEGGPGANPGVSLTLNTIAGTMPTGGKSGTQPNPAFDTRSGTLTPFTAGGTLRGVYRITNLKFEFWNDAADPGSSSPNDLGTIQQFVSARGWIVYRDPVTGAFPTLAGKGLGPTLWGVLATSVDMADVGAIINTAVTLQGPTTIVRDGKTGDVYSAQAAGVALAGNDLGAYLDTAVAPRVACNAAAYVYLESAGFGVNNSFDPVFTDTNSYDLVIVAQEHVNPGDINADGVVNAADHALFVDILLNPAAHSATERARADLNADCAVDGEDVPLFLKASL